MPINLEERTSYLRNSGRAFRNKTSNPKNELGLLSKVVKIYSEGVQLSATIWKQEENSGASAALSNRPAILLCHGWGGIRDHLDSSYAPKFAAEGFICLTFDYRTWGDSDGVIVTDKMPRGFDSMKKRRTCAELECLILKRVVDPDWQLQDIKSCLSFLRNVDGVDQDNIGIWGSSMGGGHVITMGGMDRLDRKIKCIVSQLGMMITSDLLNHVGAPSSSEIDSMEESRTVGGSLCPIAQKESDMLEDLDGYPNLAKLRTYRPIDHASLVSVPTLIMDASDEELWDRRDQGEKVYQIIQGNGITSKYSLLKGKHYDGYTVDGSFNEGCSQAISWFKQHLVRK